VRSKLYAVLSVAVMLCACQPQPPTPDPNAFLKDVYSHYANSDNSVFSVNLDDSHYFSPELIALHAENVRALKGDLGDLDADPVCDCQDYGRLKADITVDTATSRTAEATVILTDLDPNLPKEDRRPRRFHFHLVRTKDGWRIDDIGTPGYTSLRQLLINDTSNAKAEASSAAASSNQTP